MYTILIKHKERRDEHIRFPRDTTAREIVDAATFYSYRADVDVDVFLNSTHVARATNATIDTFKGTALEEYVNTRQTHLW